MHFIITLIMSFIGLLWAANHLVTGASGIASHYKISPLIIGLTLVALGASSPAIMISITAALEGQNELALGSAIGANIANIGLVLGITILLRPLTLKSSLLRREYPLVILVMLFTYSLMFDSYLSVIDGCLLLAGCIVLMGYFILIARKTGTDALMKEYHQEINANRPFTANLLSLTLGLCILPICARFLVGSATKLAHMMGVGGLVMGLTIIAIGTSLPNLAASLVAAFKGHDDIAVGTILGSNMYNLLVMMAFPGIINPSAINNTILWRDIPVMFVVTSIFLLLTHQDKKRMERWYGGLLLLIYFCYMASLIFNSTI